jgi:Chitin recognition protein
MWHHVSSQPICRCQFRYAAHLRHCRRMIAITNCYCSSIDCRQHLPRMSSSERVQNACVTYQLMTRHPFPDDMSLHLLAGLHRRHLLQQLVAQPGGQCGPSINTRCLPTQCCSQWGWCGITAAHCSTGCQPSYGTCTGKRAEATPLGDL